MNEIFGTKPWVKPIATAGSSCNTDNDETNSDAENDIPIKTGNFYLHILINILVYKHNYRICKER